MSIQMDRNLEEELCGRLSFVVGRASIRMPLNLVL